MGDMVKKEKGEVGEAMDFMEDLAGQGYDGMTVEDFSQAFVKILQPLSPAVIEDNPNYIEGAKPGLFFNQATGEVYGKSLKVIPLYYKHEWLEWKPNRGGFAGKHEPNAVAIDDSDYSEWVRKDNGNIINDTYTFYCMLPDSPEVGIVLMSFTSTNIKPAKNWNTMISMVRTPNGNQAPFFSSVWELRSTKRTDGTNTWYAIGENKVHAERLRYITGDEYNNFIKPLREMATALEVDYAKSEEEQTGMRDATPENVDY